MFIIPIGHDQSVYGRSWLTFGLIAFQALLFVWTWLAQPAANHRIEAALSQLDRISMEHPDARVRPQAVASLPEPMRRALSPIVDADADPDEDGAAALARGVKRLAEGLESSPGHRFGYRPADPHVVGFFTNVWLHADIFHLLGNMLFLWLAGTVIECFWDRIPFFILYVLAGVAGTAAHHLSAPSSTASLVGASGAIAGLLGAFVVGHPRTRIEFFYAIWAFRAFTGTVKVKAWIVLPLWFAAQVGFGLLEPGAGVAYFAHVGGFAVGVLGAILMRVTGRVYYDADAVVQRAPPSSPSKPAEPAARRAAGSPR